MPVLIAFAGLPGRQGRRPAPATLRLADLLAGLSLAIDLGIGQSPTEAMRVCLLATALARRLGLPEREVADVYYTALLQHVGCTAFRHEAAMLFGRDDDAFVAAAVKADMHDPREVLGVFLPDLARGLPAPTRRAHPRPRRRPRRGDRPGGRARYPVPGSLAPAACRGPPPG